MIINIPNSISLEDNYMVTNFVASLSDNSAFLGVFDGF